MSISLIQILKKAVQAGRQVAKLTTNPIDNLAVEVVAAIVNVFDKSEEN